MKGLTKTSRRLGAAAAAVLLAMIASSLWAGCDSFVETSPLGQLTTEDFFVTPEQAVQATNATYNMLRQWPVHVFAWIGMTDIVSDDATKGSTPSDAAFLLEFDNLNWTPSNIAFADTWTGYYQGIFRANMSIQGIQEMTDIDESLKNRLLAENRFLRAYFYYFLVRAYGGVPLILRPLQPDEYYDQPRASRDSVYAQIEEDLRFAAEHLPPQSQIGPSDLGRATRGAAQALLAEAHLFQEEFQQACELGREVINSGDYSLYPSYSGIFTPAGENSSESVFEIQTVALQEGGGGSQYSEVQGVRGVPNLGWGFNQPSDDLEAAYEPGDPRQQATILFPWERLPFGDPDGQVVEINPQTTNDRYNQKAYTPPNNPGGQGNSGTNIRRIRYSHVLLNAAEACARSGDEASALLWLNDVRARAREHDVTLGFTPELLDEDIAFDVLGLPGDATRVFVRYVHPESWAAGQLRSFASSRVEYDGGLVPVCIEQMDLIQSVNGTPITTLDDYFNAVSSLSPGQQADVELLRVSQQPCGTAGSADVQEVSVTIEARQLLPPITASGQALLEAIWHERRVELALEQHRWFDLIRQGRAAEVMAGVGKVFQVGTHELYPIPQGEVDVAGLQQNPGY